jgi:hypothetical protein
MSWTDVFVALALPMAAGLAAAAPLWHWRQHIVGNALGAGVAFTAILFLMGNAYVGQLRENQLCADGVIHCVSRVDAHMPFLLYAFIGIVDACGIFWIGLGVEERHAPKGWQAATPEK